MFASLRSVMDWPTSICVCGALEGVSKVVSALIKAFSLSSTFERAELAGDFEDLVDFGTSAAKLTTSGDLGVARAIDLGDEVGDKEFLDEARERGRFDSILAENFISDRVASSASLYSLAVFGFELSSTVLGLVRVRDVDGASFRTILARDNDGSTFLIVGFRGVFTSLRAYLFSASALGLKK